MNYNKAYIDIIFIPAILYILYMYTYLHILKTES